MLRVAQVVTRLVAGAGGVALRGALALKPDRYQVTVFTGEGESLIAQAETAGLKVVRLDSMGPRLDPRADWRCLRELTAAFRHERFDVVHTHSSKAGALGRLAARAASVPAVVHTFHGFPFHDYQPLPVRRAYLAAERRLGQLTDMFLAVGSSTAQEAIRLGIAPAHCIRTVGSAITPAAEPRTAEARDRALRLIGVPPGKRIVGTVARIDRQKAPLDLVSAIAYLKRPEVVFVWIGDGPLRESLQHRIRQLGIEERCILLGHREDVPQLLPALDVFALSSLYEGLPCAIAEAMKAGVPVVATGVNSVHELVIPGRTGILVPPRDTRSLAGAIAYLLDHAEDAARMAAAGLSAVDERFDPAVLGQDLQETYEQALAAPRRTPAWADGFPYRLIGAAA